MTNRSKIVVCALCLFVLLSVYSVLELFEWLKDREVNTWHLMNHWTTYVLRVLFIASPLSLLMILKRSILSAYLFLFTALCFASYFVFWSWLAPRPEIGLGTLAGRVFTWMILSGIVGFAVYAVRSSGEEGEEKPRWTEWRLISLFTFVVLTGSLAACQLTLEDFRIVGGLCYKAQMKHAEGDLRGEIEILDSVMQKVTDHAVALHRRAVAKIELEDFGGAISDLDRSIALTPPIGPSVVPLRFSLRGYAKHKIGDLDGAVEDYGKAIDAEQNKNLVIPGDIARCRETKARAHMNRGLIRAGRENTSGAREDFKRVLELTWKPALMEKAQKSLNALRSKES